MREFKFRAWKRMEGRWADVDELLGHLPVKYFYKPQAVLRFGNGDHMYDINMYTGLKDKNDREIYEGDVFEWEKDVFGVVRFDKGAFYLETTLKLPGDKTVSEGYYAPWLHVIIHEMNYELEVIGNIYENPELIA